MLAAHDMHMQRLVETSALASFDEDDTGRALRRFHLPAKYKGGLARQRAGWLRNAAFIGGAMQALPRWMPKRDEAGGVVTAGFMPRLAEAVGMAPGIFDDDMASPFVALTTGAACRLGEELRAAWTELQTEAGITAEEKQRADAGGGGERVLANTPETMTHPVHRHVQRMLTKEVEEKKGKELLRESRAASPRGFSESAIESVDRFSGSFLSFWTNDTTRLLQPTFTLAYTRYFGMPAPIVRGHIGRQIFRSSGEPARAGGRRHNEHDVFVDRWAARLEATTCDDGYTHQHTAFQRTTAQWIRWAGGQVSLEMENLFVSAMAPEVVEVWRADDRAAEEHVHATLALRSGVEDRRGELEATRARTRAAHDNCRAKRGVVVDLGASFDGRPLCLYEVKTLHYSDAYTTPNATSGRYGVRHRQPHASAVDYRAKLVPVERERDADRLDSALHPHRSERGEGPVRRRLRELGGVKAIVVGAFAEHSADVHELVDELAAAGAHKAAQKYLMPAHRAKGATKALLYAAFGASAWRALSALLHHRLAFIGAPGHRLGGGDALDRTRRRTEERSGVHTEAALQLLASPYGLRGFL